MKRFIRLSLIISFIFLARIALANSDVFFGERKPVGNGTGWAWVKVDKKGNPVAIGVTFTQTALSGLPVIPSSKELDSFDYLLTLPKEVTAVPFTHISLDWNPYGHAPAGIYDVPHFDIHFYILTQKERDKITAKGDDLARCYKKPASEYIPSGYILQEGMEVPHMGVHWIDSSAPELNKQPFTRTLIYGSYNGEIAFLEPMITKTFLESGPNETQTIKLPEAFQKKGYYPSEYSIKYDKLRKEYTISLDKLKWEK
ncbi:MAG: DUF5602 domain-containing protein [bacterium]|nr:DUF5602 domain-containing protein [bacterium]